MRLLKQFIIFLIIYFLTLVCMTTCNDQKTKKPAGVGDNNGNGSITEDTGIDYVMTVARSNPEPVIDQFHPGSADNEGGYENGHFIKIDGAYHLLITELFSVRHPDWGSIPARVGYWTSTDGDHWNRVCTIVEGNDIPGDPKQYSWSASWYWNEQENRWNIFWRGNAVFRYRSVVIGKDGMAGPYSEAAKVFLPMLGYNQKWDNYYTSSFGNIFTGEDGKFYVFVQGGDSSIAPGGNDPQFIRRVARADHVDGPWSSMNADGNPSFVYCENPFASIYEINGKKVYLCVYDDLSNQHSLGYGYSLDGVNWVGKTLDMTGYADWAFNQNFTQSMRTPCGLIQEDDGTFTIIYTAFAPRPDAPLYCFGSYAKIGRVNVRIKEVPKPSDKNVVFPGNMDNWQPLSGKWDVQYGEYSHSDENGSGNSVYKAETYSGVTVEASLRYVDPTQQWNPAAKAGVYVRKANVEDKPGEYKSGYYAYLTSKETVQLYAGSQLLSEVNVGKRPAIFRKLKLSVKGNRIRVFYEGETNPCIDVTDDTYKGEGYAGIDVYQSHWHYERIEIY